MDPDTCRCGCSRNAHEHFSSWRSDCGRCGRELCPTFRRPPSHLSQAAAQRINRMLAIIRRRR